MADKTESLAQVLAAGGRSQRAGRGSAAKMRLLDDADNNVGNGQIVDPGTPQPTKFVQTNPPRLLKLDALSPTGQMVTVTLTSRFTTQNGLALASGVGGPVVGIVEFGNGNGFTRIEVDVPIGRNFLAFPNLAAQSDGEDGVAIVTVPAGTLRVYLRNDSQLIPTTFSGQPVGNGLGIPDSRPWNSLVNKGTFCQAFATYFSRFATTPNTRSLLVYQTGAAAVVLPVAGLVIATNWQNLPPYAKAVRLLREPQLADATIYFFDQNFTRIDSVAVAAGVSSPTIPVPTNAVFFYVSTTIAINTMIAEFQVGL